MQKCNQDKLSNLNYLGSLEVELNMSTIKFYFAQRSSLLVNIYLPERHMDNV